MSTSPSSTNKKKGCGDTCGICITICRFVTATLAIACSAVVMAQCEFVELNNDNSEEPQFGTNITQVSVGLFKYEATRTSDDDLNQGCRSLPDVVEDTFITTARIGGLVAIVMGLVAMIIMWVEFLLVRFHTSRCITSTCFVISVVGQGLTFMIFASDVCDPARFDDIYPCNLGNTSITSMVACGLYFLSSLLVCVAPKPEPMCTRIQQKDETDPCICPPWKRTKEKDEDGDEEAANGGHNEDNEDQYPYDGESESYAPSERGFPYRSSPYAASPPQAPYHETAEVLEGDLFFDSDVGG